MVRKEVHKAMNHLSFSLVERGLVFLAGVFNLLVGLGFFFLPELHLPLWPTSIPVILDRFIGAIIIGNSVGAFWLATEHEWARVRAVALLSSVYGTLVAWSLLSHLFCLHASPSFSSYFFFVV